MKSERHNAKQNQKWIIYFLVLLGSLAVCATLLVGRSFLWFTYNDSVPNHLKAAQQVFSIQAVDVFNPGNATPKPGVPMKKTVGAANNGATPGFVRLLVVPTILAADGKTILPASFGKEVHTDFGSASTAWKDGGDGYFYLLSPLEAGKTSDNLFTEVTLDQTLGEEYANATLAIEVKCEAVNIHQWDYRLSWWGSESPPTTPALRAIDTIIKDKTIP